MPHSGDQHGKLAEHYRQGLELYFSGRHREAIEKFAFARNHKHLTGRLARYYEGLAHRSLGISALREERFDEAEKHFRSAVAALGTRAELTEYLCSLYVRADRHDRCSNEASNAAQQHPDQPDTWRRLAQSQWRSGRREEAQMTLTSALRQLGDSAKLLTQMGLFCAAENRFDEASEYLERAVRNDCDNPDVHHYLALARSARGQYAEAARSFQRAWELRPQDVMLSLQLAIAARASAEEGTPILIRLTETTSQAPAESYIGQLAGYVQSDPDFLDAFLSLPASPIDDKLFGMLGDVVRTALADHRDYADLRLHLSRIQQRLGHTDEAFANARRAVKINPKYIQALLHLGELHDQAGDVRRAIACTQRAIRCGADWPDVHCRVGELLKQSGKANRASRHFRRALELKSDYTRASGALTSLAA